MPSTRQNGFDTASFAPLGNQASAGSFAQPAMGRYPANQVASSGRSTSYTTEDFRRELKRVERRLFWLTVISLAVAVVAIIAIAGIIIQMH